MAATIKISCRNLGLADDGYVIGTSLEDLIDGVQRKLTGSRNKILANGRSDDLRSLVRSAVIQSCRPARLRSVKAC